MKRAGDMAVAASDWAVRVRPRGYVVIAAWLGLGLLLTSLGRELPLSVRILLVALVVAFYPLPWLVQVVRSFASGYRGGEGTA